MSHGGGGAIFWYCQEQYFLAVPSYLTKNNTSFQYQESTRNTVSWYCKEQYFLAVPSCPSGPCVSSGFLVLEGSIVFVRYEGTARKYCSLQYREKESQGLTVLCCAAGETVQNVQFAAVKGSSRQGRTSLKGRSHYRHRFGKRTRSANGGTPRG